MEDKLIEILSQFNYPVYRQGSMSDDDVYPETFITFWNVESPEHAYYDNKDYGTSWTFNVYVYSSEPDVAYSLIIDIRNALKSAEWLVPSKGFDTPSDHETHIGRGLEIYYLEI